MLNFLGFIPKLFSINFFKILGVITIGFAISGFFLYQRSIVKEKDMIISLLEENIKEKDLLIQSLKSKTDALQELIKERERQYEEAIKEIEKFRTIYNESQKRLEEFESKIRDKERNERIKNLLESRKNSLILKYYNENIECWMKNFDKTDGKCIQGRFVKNKDNSGEEK
jgi:septal ring factor EnvC (AmiA/AmiB activator)